MYGIRSLSTKSLKVSSSRFPASRKTENEKVRLLAAKLFCTVGNQRLPPAKPRLFPVITICPGSYTCNETSSCSFSKVPPDRQMFPASAAIAPRHPELPVPSGFLVSAPHTPLPGHTPPENGDRTVFSQTQSGCHIRFHSFLASALPLAIARQVVASAQPVYIPSDLVFHFP